METKEFIRKNNELFAKRAQIYNINSKWARIYNRKFVNYLPNIKPLKILDVCTGTGSLAMCFAEKMHQVIGLDLSEAMLAKAKQKNNFSNLKLLKGDASNLPFDNSAKDVCSISFGLHDMPHDIRIETFNEMIRVLNPNGYLLLIDYNQPNNKLLKSIYYKLTALYESDFYPSWFWGNYFYDLLKLHPCKIILNKTYLMDFARVMILKPKK